MLRRLRKAHRARNVWIDAISLNQNDPVEKAQQVPLMRNIYFDAQKTIIWLGDDYEAASQMFLLLERLAATQCSRQTMDLLMNPKEKRKERLLDDQVIFSISDTMIQTCGEDFADFQSLFAKFSDLPWFHRRWILQEAAVSRDITVYCHTEKIKWRRFIYAFALLEAFIGTATGAASCTGDLQQCKAFITIRSVQWTDTNLLDLLWDLDHAACSEPSDRLYALYGLANPASHEGLAIGLVDYTRSWDATFRRFAVSLIDSKRLLDLFRHIYAFGTLKDLDGSLPSWVPNWSGIRHRRDILSEFQHVSSFDGSDSPEYLSFRNRYATIRSTDSQKVAIGGKISTVDSVFCDPGPNVGVLTGLQEWLDSIMDNYCYLYNVSRESETSERHGVAGNLICVLATVFETMSDQALPPLKIPSHISRFDYVRSCLLTEFEHRRLPAKQSKAAYICVQSLLQDQKWKLFNCSDYRTFGICTTDVQPCDGLAVLLGPALGGHKVKPTLADSSVGFVVRLAGDGTVAGDHVQIQGISICCNRDSWGASYQTQAKDRFHQPQYILI